MPRFEAMGRQAARIVNELLAGAAPASLRCRRSRRPNSTSTGGRPADGGSTRTPIPARGRLAFPGADVLGAHRNDAIVAVVVFLLQAGLIAALVVERQRRRDAELAEQAQRFELTHASRLVVAGELTARSRTRSTSRSARS